MAVRIEKVANFKYRVNGKVVAADKEGWHTTETLNADEKKCWVKHFKSLDTTTKNRGNGSL